MKVYTEQEIVQILNGIRNDLHEPYYEHDGQQEPVPTIEAMKITMGRVYDAFGLDQGNQSIDEIEQLKQRIERLEREHTYVPMPYPVYPTSPLPLYPYYPAATYEYKVRCTGDNYSSGDHT